MLALGHTWPLASDPAHLSRVDAADGALNAWAVAWVAHQLPRDLPHLFDANIFYPEPHALAYSEAMIVQGAIAAPVAALGGSAVLAYNVALLAGLALTGWAFCLLVGRWTGSWTAGILAGSLAAFNAHTLTQVTHLQFLHVEFIAVILFALDRLAAAGRTRDALTLGVGVALQGLTSVYLLVFSIWMLVFAVAARAREAMLAHGRRALLLLALAAVCATTLLAPYLYVYLEVHNATGWARGPVDAWGASWVNYLATGARAHWNLWSRPFAEAASSFTFPGLTALALAVAAVASPACRRDARVRMCAAAALGCAVVSFAPSWPFYPALHAAIPLFQAVRVPAHLGQIVLLMTAILAGFGLARLERRWAGRRWTLAAGAALIALVNLEAMRAPLGLTRFPGVPEAYDALAAVQGAIVAEFPFPQPSQWFLNAPYMLDSTRHWHPMLNGYSGFRPASYDRACESLQRFPDDDSLQALHRLGVTHVIVHRQAFGAERFEAVRRTPSLKLFAWDDDVFVLEVREP